MFGKHLRNSVLNLFSQPWLQVTEVFFVDIYKYSMYRLALIYNKRPVLPTITSVYGKEKRITFAIHGIQRRNTSTIKDHPKSGITLICNFSPLDIATPIPPNLIPENKKANFGRLIELMKPEMKLFGISFVSLAISAATSLAIPYSMGTIIDIISNVRTDLPLTSVLYNS
jgi:hypothetical protein